MRDLLLLFVFPAFITWSAVSDLLRMTISNRVCLGLTLAFVVMALFTGMTLPQAGWHLAQAVYNLVMTGNIQRVVFGGGVARAGLSFLDPIEAALELLRQASPVAAEVLRPGLIGLVPEGYEAALWGALTLASER